MLADNGYYQIDALEYAFYLGVKSSYSRSKRKYEE